jgi:hypothetical protein
MKKTLSVTILILVFVLLCSCGTTSNGSGGNLFSHLFAAKESPELAPLEPIGDEDAPSLAPLEPVTDQTDDDLPSLAPLEPLGTPSASPGAAVSPSGSKPTPIDADWVMQVDDSQDYMNKDSGLLYHCNLYIYAEKAGGTDVLGMYTAQIVLKMEPDLQQLTEMMGEDGLVVDSISGGDVLLEGNSVEFEMVTFNAKDFAAKMKEIAPDQPGMQMTIPDTTMNAMVLELISMKFSYNSAEGTGHDESGNGVEGWGQDAATTVDEPIVIEADGASVYVSFPKYGFDRAFKGTVIGNAG